MASSLSGLEILQPLDRIFIDRKAGGWEVFPGEYGQNHYAILDVEGRPLFSVQESSQDSGKLFLGNSQSFRMKVFDQCGSEVLTLAKPHSFIGDEVEVFVGSEKLGSIKRDAFSVIPKIRIYDAENNRMLKISGPIFGLEDEFEVRATSGRKIGELKKKVWDLGTDCASPVGKYGVTFPRNLNVMGKALLMAVAILMNFAYFHCS